MKDTINGSYINLATWRKNGKRVNTPVWFAEAGETGCYYLFSAGNAGKIKRIRNNPYVEIACCDVTGKLNGNWVKAKATLLDNNQEITLAKKAFNRKYGWQSGMINFFSKISGKIGKRCYILLKCT